MSAHAETAPLAAGTAVGSLRLLDCIARDPDGWLYRAQETDTGRAALVLEFFPHGLAQRDPSTGIEPLPDAATELTQRTARFILAASESMGLQHPNLMRVKGCVVEEGSVHVRLADHDGMTLAQRMALDTPVSPHELERWVHDACQGLSALHRSRHLHGGLTPERILIRPQGSLTLLPLAIEPRQSPPGPEGDPKQAPAFTLSPWLAPEQKWTTAALRQGPWTDLYALAAMAVQCLTGEPFPNVLHRVDGKRLPNLGTWVEQGHRREFLDGLLHALEMSPDARPRSATDWLREMGLDGLPPPEPEVEEVQPVEIRSTPDEAPKVTALPEVIEGIAKAAEVVSHPSPSAAPASVQRLRSSLKPARRPPPPPKVSAYGPALAPSHRMPRAVWGASIGAIVVVVGLMVSHFWSNAASPTETAPTASVATPPVQTKAEKTAAPAEPPVPKVQRPSGAEHKPRRASGAEQVAWLSPSSASRGRGTHDPHHQKALDDCIDALMQQSEHPDTARRSAVESACR